MVSVQQARTERAKAQRFWASLQSSERWEIGDQLVLGDFDPADWFDRRPSNTFMDELDNLRILWEMDR